MHFIRRLHSLNHQKKKTPWNLRQRLEIRDIFYLQYQRSHRELISPAENPGALSFFTLARAKTWVMLRLPVLPRAKVKPRVMSGNLSLDLAQELFIYSKCHINSHAPETPSKAAAAGRRAAPQARTADSPQGGCGPGTQRMRERRKQDQRAVPGITQCHCPWGTAWMRIYFHLSLLTSLLSISPAGCESEGFGLLCLCNTPLTELSKRSSPWSDVQLQSQPQHGSEKLAHPALESHWARKCSGKCRTTALHVTRNKNWEEFWAHACKLYCKHTRTDPTGSGLSCRPPLPAQVRALGWFSLGDQPMTLFQQFFRRD